MTGCSLLSLIHRLLVVLTTCYMQTISDLLEQLVASLSLINFRHLWTDSNFNESWWEFSLRTWWYPVNSHRLSCNSCSRLTGAWELRKLSCELSLLNSHQLSCNSCSRLTGAWELRKLSCKLSLLNSHQLSCNSCSRLTGAWELRKLSCKLSLFNSYQLSKA
jgi:hypothetical protein